MRLACLLVIALCLVSCSERTTSPKGAEQSRWVLPDDEMSLGFLVVDAETDTFECGLLTHYESCHGCDTSGIPLDRRTEPDPSRLRLYVALVYTETGDTVWHSFDVWAGPGAILYPDSFWSATEFDDVGPGRSLPPDVELLHPRSGLPPDILADMEQAWEAVSNLDLVNEFAAHPFRVGAIYHSGVQWRDTTKWVFVLYYGGKSGKVGSI